MLICINYANERFANAQKLNTKTAIHRGKADKVIEYGPADLDKEFLVRNVGLLNAARGGGYWVWKPYIIRKTLQQMNEGDYLCYCDAGAIYLRPVSLLISEMERMGQNVMCFAIPYLEKHWSKRDAFILLDCDAPEYADTYQRRSGFMILKNNADSRALIDEWLRYVRDRRIVSDDPNVLGKPNYDGFMENRHDQTIWSLLTKKHGIPAFRDPDERPGSTHCDIDGRYPKTVIVTRNPTASSRIALIFSQWLPVRIRILSGALKNKFYEKALTASYALYFGFGGRLKRKNGAVMKFLFRCGACLSEKFLNGPYSRHLAHMRNDGLNQAPREEKIVASLTSFPARIEQTWIAVETIFQQSVKADAVELWLSEEEFPNGLADLPQKLLMQRERGLSICFCNGNLRSHKKYYYAMQKHPDAVVITFDDDIYYPADSIRRLLELHRQSPRDAVGMSTPTFSADDLMRPLDWKMAETVTCASACLGVCGCGGTLFPPGVLSEKAFDPEAIRELCPFADDLWLTAMVYANGRRFSTVGRNPFPMAIPETQGVALMATNNRADDPLNNNVQWANILRRYEPELRPWLEEVNARMPQGAEEG